MKPRVARSFPAVIFSLCFVVAAVAQDSASIAFQELPNFHQVNSQLYRGAQPRRGGLDRLAKLGIKTVIDLRAGDTLAHAEESEARAAGLRYFGVPFKRTGRPTDEQINRVLAIINDPANQPVFVHCRLGEDRTGTVIAIYRIVHDGWTSERAKAEANRIGMHPWEVGMKNYIHDYYQRRVNGNTSAVETTAPSSSDKTAIIQSAMQLRLESEGPAEFSGYLVFSDRNMSPDLLPRIPGFDFRIMKPGELEKRRRSVEHFKYLEIGEFSGKGNSIGLSLLVIERSGGLPMHSRVYKYSFRKIDGQWQGKLVMIIC